MLVLITAVSAVSVINYIINPYGTFKQEETCWLNCKKPYVISDRMSKFYQFKQSKANSIIMGTSRSGLFSPAILSAYVEPPVFNFSLAGSSLEEQAAYIKYSITQGGVKNILWSLDFFSFNPTKPLHPDFKPERLTSDIYFPDYQVSLFNFITFKNSLLTLIANYPFKTKNRNDIRASMFDSLKEQTLTLESINFNINYTLDEYRREKSFLNSEEMKSPVSIVKALGLVKEVVGLCKAKNINIQIYTSPVYQEHQLLYYKAGLWNTYIEWKKRLAEITDYTDFSLCNTITNKKNNFRDSSHIIGKFGYKITQTIYNSSSSNVNTEFGVRVTSTTIDKHLENYSKGCLK